MEFFKEIAYIILYLSPGWVMNDYLLDKKWEQIDIAIYCMFTQSVWFILLGLFAILMKHTSS